MPIKDEYKRFHQILPSFFELFDRNYEEIYLSKDMQRRISFLRYIMEESFDELWSHLWDPSISTDPISFHEFTNKNDILSYIFNGHSKKELRNIVLKNNQSIWFEIEGKLNDGMV